MAILATFTHPSAFAERSDVVNSPVPEARGLQLAVLATRPGPALENGISAEAAHRLFSDRRPSVVAGCNLALPGAQHGQC